MELKEIIQNIGIIFQDILKEVGFKCTRCGKCCEVEDYYPKESIQYITRLLWIGETDNMNKEGWESFPKGTITPECWKGRFKLVKKAGVITCFFQDRIKKTCTIWENRAIICRGYPIFINHNANIIIADKCKGMKKLGLTGYDFVKSKNIMRLMPLLAKLKDDIEKVNVNFEIRHYP